MSVRIVVVGGFLGAGKTTFLLKAAQELTARGYRIGLITNDQGRDLVDTALGEMAMFPVAEVAGGCFCCRFPDLLTSLQHLKESVDPDIILAEPVGSCTDLVATVLRPLTEFYGEQYELAPLTVLLDSSRNIESFPADVRYLYQQQLTEAELIVLSKCDLRTPAELLAQDVSSRTAFPKARTLQSSALNGEGFDTWLDIVLGQTSANPEALVIDYEQYARAEAALGWLNAKGQVRADFDYSLHQWTSDLLTNLAQLCIQNQSPIAHIKTMVTETFLPTKPEGPVPIDGDALSPTRLKASLTQDNLAINWDLEGVQAEAKAHEFILNIRVNALPRLLEQLTVQALENTKPYPNSRYYLQHIECFSPLPPQPSHRLS